MHGKFATRVQNSLPWTVSQQISYRRCALGNQKLHRPQIAEGSGAYWVNNLVYSVVVDQFWVASTAGRAEDGATFSIELHAAYLKAMPRYRHHLRGEIGSIVHFHIVIHLLALLRFPCAVSLSSD